MYKLVSTFALSAAIACAADDKTPFLTVEYEYVSELLTMGLPSFAQSHLDIVKREFPTQTAEIAYYQAHIYFKQTKYAKSAVQLERLIKGNPSAARLSETRKLLALAYLRIKKFDDAIRYFKLVKPFGGPKSWYAETCVELGEAQALAFSKTSAADRVELKKGAFTILNAYQAQYPKSDQAPTIKYYLAEFEYDNLVSLLYKLGNVKTEASPEVRAQKNKAIIIQLHKARKIYQSILDDHATSPVVQRVKPRLKYLATVVEKMKRNER